MEAVSGEKVIFEKAANSDTDRGKEMNFIGKMKYSYNHTQNNAFYLDSTRN